MSEEELKAKLLETWKLADGGSGNQEAYRLEFSGEAARFFWEMVEKEAEGD